MRKGTLYIVIKCRQLNLFYKLWIRRQIKIDRKGRDKDMLFIRAFGVGLILFSSTAIGLLYANRLKEQIEELETIKKLLLMLRGEIKYTKTPLPDAFASIAVRMKEPFGSFLEELAKQMENPERIKGPYGELLFKVAGQMDSMKGQTLAQIWEACVAEYLKESALLKEEKEKWVHFGSQLGYLDKEMQVSTIELYLEQVQEEIKNAQENFKRNGKLYRMMGVMAGIFLVILML